QKMQVAIEIPDFFRKKFSQTKPNGALKVIQKSFKKVSKELLPLYKLLVALLFMATRSRTMIEDNKKVRKSLWKSPFFTAKEPEIILPSAFHRRIKQDRIKKAKDPLYQPKFANCVLNYGNSKDTRMVASAA